MTDAYAGLPDPETEAAFYDGLPGKRLAAWLLDVLVVFAITVVLVPLTAFTALFYFPALAMAVGFVYRSLTIAGRSATPGMRLMGIELRTGAGAPLDLGMAVLHTLAYTVFFSVMIPQLISVALVLSGARAQTLHDHLLGTAAINRAA